LNVIRIEAKNLEQRLGSVDQKPDDDPFAMAETGDLVIIEDLHRLLSAAGGCRLGITEALVGLLDTVSARERLVVITSLVGPSRLSQVSWRMATRLSGGLVVGIEPWQAHSRLLFLQNEAQHRQLAVGQDILMWLASRLAGGGRQLQGAITQLETLTRLHKRILDLRTVREHFQSQAEAARPTAERIAQCVGSYFRVQTRQLQSRRRYRSILLPRQIGMYMARALTGLSLKQIGAYFGGRDHSTVLHACRKIERDLNRDPVLSGTIRQLRMELA
jgi:chromosomal replication initiator protein